MKFFLVVFLIATTLGADIVYTEVSPTDEKESIAQSSPLKKSNDAPTASPTQLDICSICYDDLSTEEKEKFKTQCGHSFHPDCLNKWKAHHNTCPICRAKLVLSEKQLLDSAFDRDFNSVFQLIDEGVSVNATDDRLGFEGYTALHYAVMQDNVDAVESLIDKGAIVNAQNEVLGTSLHMAASYGFPEIIRVLLKGGADVDARDDLHSTALMMAAQFGGLEAVQFLLNNEIKEADPTLVDRSGETALTLAGTDEIKAVIQKALDERSLSTARIRR